MNNHFAIPVKDLEKSKNFYEKIGFELFKSWEKPNQQLKGAWLKDKDGYNVELIHHPTNENLTFPKIPEVLHLGIGVKNLEIELEKLQKNGAEIIIPITKGVSVKRFAFIKDPNGFPIELVEY
jgi:glyoxylase I family protein